MGTLQLTAIASLWTPPAQAARGLSKGQIKACPDFSFAYLNRNFQVKVWKVTPW